MSFKNYYGLYNIIFSCILSLACLAKESKGKKCYSTFGEFEAYYNSAMNTSLNITGFMLNQIKQMSQQISMVKQQIMETLSNSDDDELVVLVNSNLSTFYLTQNITKNEIKLNFFSFNNSFSEVLDYMCTGFLVMTSKYESLNETVYIVNQIDQKKQTNDPFIHVNLTTQLSQYQNYFYFLVLNYVTFIKKLYMISFRLIIKTSILFERNIHLAYAFVGTNFFFIYYYIY